MNFTDISYLATVTIIGRLARCFASMLPSNWQLRLKAKGPAFASGWIWVHAVSVGELILAEGIIFRLLDSGYRIHVTTGTSAGLDVLNKRLPEWSRGDRSVTGGSFPLDDGYGLDSFLRSPPGAFISLETEIWPNLLRELNIRDIESYIINGRLTERSLSAGKRWITKAASRLSLVVARDEASAQAFLGLGAPNVVLGGNLKVDVLLSDARVLHAGWKSLRKAWSGYPIIVAGNTVDAEEDLILQVWKRARLVYPGLRLIVAPRHPSRFQSVADLLAAESLIFRRSCVDWSDNSEDWDSVDILLLDTMGELASVYGEGTVALVGGGWFWSGGHNPMESIRCGLPTIIGPGFKNFEDLVIPLIKAKLIQVVSADRLVDAVVDSLASASLRPSADLCQSVKLPECLTGALDKTWQIIKDVLPMP